MGTLEHVLLKILSNLGSPPQFTQGPTYKAQFTLGPTYKEQIDAKKLFTESNRAQYNAGKHSCCIQMWMMT